MKILVVCLGNICRSPLAEGILKEVFPVNFYFDSAGTIDMHKGKAPDIRSIQVAKQNGIDISNQKSRPIEFTDFEKFDEIWCMDRSVYQDVINKVQKEEKQKVKLFLDIVNSEDLPKDVPDPYWGEYKDFEEVFNLLYKASEIIKTKYC